MPDSRTDIASELTATTKTCQGGLKELGLRTNCTSRDASACLSWNSASRNSPSGTRTKSHDGVFIALDQGCHSRPNKRWNCRPELQLAGVKDGSECQTFREDFSGFRGNFLVKAIGGPDSYLKNVRIARVPIRPNGDENSLKPGCLKLISLFKKPKNVPRRGFWIARENLIL